jgi:hypothetical protein
VTQRPPLELERPVVDGSAAGSEELGIADRRHPDPDRRVHELGPHAFLIEVVQTPVPVVGARRALGVAGIAVDVGERCDRARDAALERLPVDVDGLGAAVVGLDAPGMRSAARRQGRGEQVAGSSRCESPEFAQTSSGMGHRIRVR